MVGSTVVSESVTTEAAIIPVFVQNHKALRTSVIETRPPPPSWLCRSNKDAANNERGFANRNGGGPFSFFATGMPGETGHGGEKGWATNQVQQWKKGKMHKIVVENSIE